MAAVRRDVLADAAARRAFIEGVLALKAEHLGPTTADFGIPGPARPVSTYDLFTIWHHLAMMRMTPPGQADRNAAHSGPAFLPWHRLMLVLLELQLQRVLGDDTVGIPYWDWAADGDRSPDPREQAGSPLWDGATGLGGSGAPVGDGPFGPGTFRVEVESDRFGRLRATDRGLRRALGRAGFPLPTTAQVSAVLAMTPYDRGPYDSDATSFRNHLEGWRPDSPAMHNVVHVWVGGDMAPASSPNDPVFYLNHCNVDRLWEAWMARHGRAYEPGPDAPDVLAGHRLDDPLYSILTSQPITPADLLDAEAFTTYDHVP